MTPRAWLEPLAPFYWHFHPSLFRQVGLSKRKKALRARKEKSSPAMCGSGMNSQRCVVNLLATVSTSSNIFASLITGMYGMSLQSNFAWHPWAFATSVATCIQSQNLILAILTIQISCTAMLAILWQVQQILSVRNQRSILALLSSFYMMH